MLPLRTLSYGLLVLAIACSPEGGPPESAGSAMWFEGARLIVGDGGAPIESSAFLVEEGTFTWVGRQGEMAPPDGAVRVDLRGKTVIPALIDAHQHIGLTNISDGTNSKDNYTRENLIEHLERSAYHGVAATMSLGLEADEALAFQLRDETISDAALFLTSGRGIAGTPMAGPTQAYRLGIPRGALTEAEGRGAVQELRANNVALVKIWVDDRGGTVPKVEPNVYRAIIDEAHAHGMRVVAHLGRTSALEDAKDLLRAGIDGFAHTIRDRDIDEEYMALVRHYPEVWTIPNLPGSPVTMADLPWLAETLPPFEIENLREQIERVGPQGPTSLFQLQCRNLARNHEAGMLIGMGTDLGDERRLDHAYRAAGHGVVWTQPHGGDCRGDADERRDPRARPARDVGGREERLFCGAGREPPGGHHSDPPDFSRLSPGRGGGSRGAQGQVVPFAMTVAFGRRCIPLRDDAL